MILSPTSQIGHHHKVTNITMSPSSLSPIRMFMEFFRPTMVYAGGMALRSHWCDYYKRQGWFSNSSWVENTSTLVSKTIKRMINHQTLQQSQLWDLSISQQQRLLVSEILSWHMLVFTCFTMKRILIQLLVLQKN